MLMSRLIGQDFELHRRICDKSSHRRSYPRRVNVIRGMARPCSGHNHDNLMVYATD